MKKYRVKNMICNRDVIPNIIETYSSELLRASNADMFYEILKRNRYNIIGYHITRLTKEEIIDIKRNGLSFGGKDLLYRKVKNLPTCCSWFKDELIQYIDNLRETQADCAIYASYGFLDLERDFACRNIFHINWGGESIYNYYDKGNGFQDEHLRKIHETLQSVSVPCLLILRINVSELNENQYERLYQKLKQSKIKEFSGGVYIQYKSPQVLDIVDLSVYDEFDVF